MDERKLSEILKTMTLKQKISYIIEYYKFYFLGAIIILGIIYSIINTVFLNPQPQTYLGVSFVGTYIPEEITLEMEEKMFKALVKDPNENVKISIFSYSGEDNSQYDMAMNAKFLAMVQTNEFDITIFDDKHLEAMKEGLDELSNFFTEEEINSFSDEFLFNENNEPVAIILKESPLLDEYNIDYKNKFMGIYMGTERISQTKEGFKYILK